MSGSLVRSMSISAPPSDWRRLQTEVALILSECGMDAVVEHPLSLARGAARIDVYATDSENQPPSVYLCECKQWSKAVPQAVVHSFRTVVQDAGANFGLLITSRGFQSGAVEAAANTNVKLLSWDEFQLMFLNRWLSNSLAPTLAGVSEPLVDYTELFNNRVFCKANALSKKEKDEFRRLRERHADLAFLVLAIIMPFSSRLGKPLCLPLSHSSFDAMSRLPDDLINEPLYRPFLTKLVAHVEHGISEFDALFGERA